MKTASKIALLVTVFFYALFCENPSLHAANGPTEKVRYSCTGFLTGEKVQMAAPIEPASGATNFMLEIDQATDTLNYELAPVGNVNARLVKTAMAFRGTASQSDTGQVAMSEITIALNRISGSVVVTFVKDGRHHLFFSGSCTDTANKTKM